MAKNPVPKPATLNDALASFQSSGDPAADVEKIKPLLGELNGGELSSTDAPDLSALTNLLGQFESTDKLISDIMGLFAHINTASEHRTAPGAN